jgi:threonine synthase
MNVGHPSNLSRIIALYGGNMDETGIIIEPPNINKMNEDLFGVSVTDEDTRKTIAYLKRKYDILLEPHGAVAWYGMKQYFKSNISNSKKQLCISLETAHPAKFPEELQKTINLSPPLPSSLAGLESKTESYFTFENNYQLLKEFIINNN